MRHPSRTSSTSRRRTSRSLAMWRSRFARARWSRARRCPYRRTRLPAPPACASFSIRRTAAIGIRSSTVRIVARVSRSSKRCRMTDRGPRWGASRCVRTARANTTIHGIAGTTRSPLPALPAAPSYGWNSPGQQTERASAMNPIEQVAAWRRARTRSRRRWRCCARDASWPSRGSVGFISRVMPGARQRSPASGRASAARRSPSR